MATKVFLKWLGETSNELSSGKEYHLYGQTYIRLNNGASFHTQGLGPAWQRIEREVFTANGFEWFRHVPGEPMPCDPEANVVGLSMCMREFKNKAQFLDWTHNESGALLIVWRYADSERKEPAVQLAQIFGSPVAVGWEHCSGVWIGEARIADADESERNDLIAAVDDGHLTPGQKAYIQGKEDAQAAKQQLKHDAEAKALQERADQLADAGKAMDRVNQGHDHRLGWVQ